MSALPPLGDLLLKVRFEGRDPAREDRRDSDGTRRYDERGGWNFDSNELLEMPDGSTTTLRAHLPPDNLLHCLFSTSRRWHENLDAAVTVTFENSENAPEFYVGLQIRSSRYLILSSRGRFAIVYQPLSMPVDQSGSWDIVWQGEVTTNPEARYRLRAVMRGTATNLFINNQFVGELEEYAGLYNIGWIGIVACSNGHNASVLLDSIELRDPITAAPFEGEPVYLKVTVTDALTSESGAPSGESQWTFYLQTPEQWATAPDLNERVFKATRRLYREFNEQGDPQGERSRYMLRSTETILIDERQAALKPWKHKNLTLYVLQPDGTMKKAN